MIGNCLRVLLCTLVFEVGGDAGRAESVIADLGCDAGCGGTPLDLYGRRPAARVPRRGQSCDRPSGTTGPAGSWAMPAASM